MKYVLIDKNIDTCYDCPYASIAQWLGGRDCGHPNRNRPYDCDASYARTPISKWCPLPDVINHEEIDTQTINKEGIKADKPISTYIIQAWHQRQMRGRTIANKHIDVSTSDYLRQAIAVGWVDVARCAADLVSMCSCDTAPEMILDMYPGRCGRCGKALYTLVRGK